MDEEGRIDETTGQEEVAGDALAPVGEGPPEEAPAAPERRRGLRWRRVFRLSAWGLFVVVALVVLFFTQTTRGQSIILDELLSRVRGSLAGELSVERIRSRTLLFGATLVGVRLEAEGGRPFLEADSIVIRYSPLSLAIGSPRLRSSTFYGLDLEISRYPGEDFANVDRVVLPGPPDSITSPPITLGLGRIGVRDGHVEILTPTTDSPEELTVPAPDGGRLRRMVIDDLDLDVERTVFRSEGPVMVDARLASLSASISVLAEPLVIHEAQGDLSFGDLGLRLEDSAFRLPGSYLEGGFSLGPDRPGDPWVFSADFRARDWGDLADFAWVDARIPAGRFRGGVGVRLVEGIDLALRNLDVQTGVSALTFDGGANFGDVLSLRSLRVTAAPVTLAALEPWLERDLPFEGTLRGNATLGGTFADLAATGRMTFTPDSLPDAASTADFSGTIHLGENPGGSALEVRLDPFDYRVIAPVWPDAERLGSGRATVSVQGRADSGLLVVADLLHRSDATTTSRAVGRATLRRRLDGEWIVGARGELMPLSLPLLGRLWPEIDLPGSVRGPVRVDGSLRDLHVVADLVGDEGRLMFDGHADATAIGAGYRFDADAEGVDLSAFTSSVPTPSIFSGRLTMEASGLSLDSLEGSASLALRSGRIGALTIDSVSTGLAFDQGMLTATDLVASVGGVALTGEGSLGLVDGRDGASRFDFSSETLLGLRPVFMGDSILVGDTLNPLELDALRARGIDPDTLPTAMDVRMAGRVKGTANVQGWLGDFDVDMLFDLAEGAYGHNSVDSAHVSLVASGLPETLGAWDVELDATNVAWADRQFQQVGFDGTMVQRRGDGVLNVVRRPDETYFLTGAFALDSLGGELELTDARAQVRDQRWILSQPTRMVWNETSLTVDTLEVRRSDDDPMLLTASGTLTRGGDSDFRLVMEGFHVEEALQMAQREDIDLSGHVDLRLDVTGPAERPIITARFDVDDPRYGDFRLTRLEGSLAYEDLSADVDLAAWVGERQVLTGTGVIPVNLALTEVEEREVDEDMDVTVTADSLDASLALVYLSALENVTGTVSAEMHVGGTPSAPEPRGRVVLENAAWTIEALGVRHTGVSGELLLQPNRTVGIKLATTGGGTSSGTSTISGLVRLEEPLSSSVLDSLQINFDRFLAVDRRDMQARISGDLILGGTYQAPVIDGTLRMEEATLFVEEFARNAGVVDLRSPLTYAPTIAVDTTVFVSQPLIAGISNPFLDNLRVDVDLQAPRNLWLRSSEMNVEMGGDLIVVYDRQDGDLVLVGEVQALRGSYQVLGRTFEVDGGTASFLGQSGVNPTLDIQALSRVRRRDGDPLEVRASVQGTLVEPVVTLSTEETGVSQSDLISYLLFGMSSAEVASGQGLTTGGVALFTGTLVNELGTAIAQEIPLVNRLDYLAFSQSATYESGTGIGVNTGTVWGGAQVELGKYLNDHVFVIFVLGGASGSGAEGDAGTSVTLRGVRVELSLDQLVDNLSVEGFWEDRFLRSTTGGLGSTGLEGEKTVGIVLFGDWGFGSQRREQD